MYDLRKMKWRRHGRMTASSFHSSKPINNNMPCFFSFIHFDFVFIVLSLEMKYPEKNLKQNNSVTVKIVSNNGIRYLCYI